MSVSTNSLSNPISTSEGPNDEKLGKINEKAEEYILTDADVKPLFKFYNNPMMSDITFKVGDFTFYGHKFILASRSEIFRIQFFGNFTKAVECEINNVDICDIGEAAFATILRYIYGGISNLNTKNLSGFGLLESLIGAKKYLLDGLKDHLVTEINALQDKESAIKIFEATFLHQEIDRKKRIEILHNYPRKLDIQLCEKIPFKTFIENCSEYLPVPCILTLLILWARNQNPNIKEGQILDALKDFEPMSYIHKLNRVDMEEIVIKPQLLEGSQLIQAMLNAATICHNLYAKIKYKKCWYFTLTKGVEEILYEYRTYYIIGLVFNETFNKVKRILIQLFTQNELRLEYKFLTEPTCKNGTPDIPLYPNYTCKIYLDYKPQINLTADEYKIEITPLDNCQIEKIQYL